MNQSNLQKVRLSSHAKSIEDARNAIRDLGYFWAEGSNIGHVRTLFEMLCDDFRALTFEEIKPTWEYVIYQQGRIPKDKLERIAQQRYSYQQRNCRPVGWT